MLQCDRRKRLRRPQTSRSTGSYQRTNQISLGPIIASPVNALSGYRRRGSDLRKKAQAFPSKDKRKGAKKPSETRFKSPTASGKGGGTPRDRRRPPRPRPIPRRSADGDRGRATASEPRPTALAVLECHTALPIYSGYSSSSGISIRAAQKGKTLRKHETHPSSSASQRAVVLAGSKNGSADAGGEDAEARFIEEQGRKP